MFCQQCIYLSVPWLKCVLQEIFFGIIIHKIPKTYNSLSKGEGLYVYECHFPKLIKLGSLVFLFYNLKIILVIGLKKKKNCQISQGLIIGLIAVLKPMSSGCYTIQDVLSLSTLKDQFLLLFFMLKTTSYKEIAYHEQVISSWNICPWENKCDWNPVTKEMV